MSIYEYDQEGHNRLEREGAYEDGRKEGIEEGKAEGIGLGARLKLKEQVEKKLGKGDSVEKMADDLIEDIAVIEKIVAELKR